LKSILMRKGEDGQYKQRFTRIGEEKIDSFVKGVQRCFCLGQ